MSEHILLAYEFDSKGKGKSLKNNKISKLLKDNKLAWVHMDANHEDTRPWLEREITYLPPFIIDALLVDETRPRMMQINDGVLLILRGVNLNQDANPEDMVSIRLWVDKHRIISIQKRNLKAISDIEDRIISFSKPIDSGQFIAMLLECLFRRMESTLMHLDEKTDDIEEMIIDSSSPDLRASISIIRKQAIIFRRYMAPQREAIDQLRMSNLKWLNEGHKRQLQESYNSITRYVEDLDAIRERAQIIKDEWVNIMTDKLNKNMYVLSVIAAIFLPVGFLTGLLGVNIGGIPGTNNPESFIIFCGILLIIIALQITLFKKMKWF
jgi:zinc transporter